MPLGHEWNAPYIPFDFSVTMPHHLGQTDQEGGPYIRDGKSYTDLWIHAIGGGKTRFWTSDDSSQAEQQGATEAYIIPLPGEEENKGRVGDVDITRHLTNPLTPQSIYNNETRPWEGANAQDDAESFKRGVHPMPRNERKLAGRGLTVGFWVRWSADKNRFMGWGGVFGPGPQNIFTADPSYPYPG